jgi:GT2 family glycosyltransferase
MFSPRVFTSEEVAPSASPGDQTPLQKRPDISICVPVWKRHSPPDLATLQASLHHALAGLTAELIVVLNGVSRSDVLLTERTVVVEFATNRGVPVAWNRAAAAANAEVLCFVNDDVVLGHSALRLLWDAARRHAAGVVGPVGTRWDVSTGTHLAYVSTDGLAAGEVEPCEVVSGFLFATRRDVFEAVGGFDEAYTPCGFEEVDYCTAVRLRLGLECYAVAGIPHQHEFGVSAQRHWRRIRYDGRTESIGHITRRNREHFLAKWARRASLEGNGPHR